MKLSRVLAALFAVCSSMPTLAAEIGLASFNLAWAGTETDFLRHIAICNSAEVNWCDTRAKVSKGSTEPSPPEALRAAQCQSAFDTTSGGAPEGMLVAPCNAYKLTARKWEKGGAALYLEKLDGLRQTVERVVSEHRIDVIAFQEVRSDEVIHTILGKYAAEFDTCVAAHTAFQTVGFAWRKTLPTKPAQCVRESGLAIKEKPGDPAALRTLRPGLALNLTIGENTVAILNVHLKSACANLVTGSGFPGHQLTDADPACRILNRQVAPLEDWIERVASTSPLFVLLGDFNRRLDEESAKAIPLDKVRTDGTDPAGPNKTGQNGEVASKYLWQELSDGRPSLVQIPLTPATTTCLGFAGLDHILISDALNARQPSLPISRKFPVEKKPRQTIQTSDHCPRVTTISL